MSIKLIIKEKSLHYVRLARERFLRLSSKEKICTMVIAASLVSFLLGPLLISFSSRDILKESAIKRGELLARNLASVNAHALIKGEDALYRTDSVTGEAGVLDAYLTDSTGLVVAPPNRFHEDARKDPLIKKGLSKNESSAVQNGAVLEIAEPAMDGNRLVGISRISYSVSKALPWSYLLALIRTFFIMSVITAALIYGVHLIMKEDASTQKATEEVTMIAEKADVRFDAISLASNLKVPVVIFDKGFRVSFANNAAAEVYPNIGDSHIVDLGAEHTSAAEEIEMLQKDSVEKNGVKLWRIEENGATVGYGMTIQQSAVSKKLVIPAVVSGDLECVN